MEEAKALKQSLAVLPESVVTVNVSRLRISVRGSNNHKPWRISPTSHIFKQLDVKSHTQSVRFAQLRLPPGWPAHYSSCGGRGDVFFSCTEEAQYPVPAKRSNTAQSRPGPWLSLRGPNAAETKATGSPRWWYMRCASICTSDSWRPVTVWVKVGT